MFTTQNRFNIKNYIFPIALKNYDEFKNKETNKTTVEK